jgi:hypothetical protein
VGCDGIAPRWGACLEMRGAPVRSLAQQLLSDELAPHIPHVGRVIVSSDPAAMRRRSMKSRAVCGGNGEDIEGNGMRFTAFHTM